MTECTKMLIDLLDTVPCPSPVEGEPGSCQEREDGCCGQIRELSYCAVRRMATYLTEKGVVPMRWVPVAEGSPEKHKPVLVCRRNKEGRILVEQGCRDLDGWWRVYGTRVKSVLFWMLIPEPPEEVRNG